jgi:hypothetical protein
VRVKIMRLLINAVFAATVGYTLSVLINSSVSAATLVGFGIEVTIGDRFQMFATEWLGLASTYLLIYVLLHTVVFLLVNHFAYNADEPRVSNPATGHALFAIAGALSLLLVYMGLDTGNGAQRCSGCLWPNSRWPHGACCYGCGIGANFFQIE